MLMCSECPCGALGPLAQREAAAYVDVLVSALKQTGGFCLAHLLNKQSRGTSTILVLLDLRTLCPEDSRKFERNFKRFMATVLAGPHHGLVYRGVKETMQFYGAGNLATIIQNTTLNNPSKLFMMEEGDEIFDRVCVRV